MIGIAGPVISIIFMSMFTVLIIPTISVVGVKKMEAISKLNSAKRIMILTVFYFVVLLLGHFTLIALLKTGFIYSMIWIGVLLLSSVLFSFYMSKAKN